MTSLPVASPRAWTMRSWLWPPSRPRARWPPAWSNCVPQSTSSAMRCGASRTTLLDHGRIAQRAAGLKRVGHVVLEAVVRVEHGGDAPLGVGAVRLADVLLGDDQDREFRIDGQRRPQPGQPAADDQHVGEEVRHALGMERNEISGDGARHNGIWRLPARRPSPLSLPSGARPHQRVR